MSFFLRNYTSDVPVHVTIARIEQVLITCGVTGIMKEYADTEGRVKAITFQLPGLENGDKMTVRLPADEDAALEVLWNNYVGDDQENLASNRTEFTWGKKKKKKSHFIQQAQRTAWRLVQDWVEVEMSRVMMKQGEPREIFMSYLWDGKRTFYQAVKDRGGFKALLAETN